jgi:acyl-coenzyme A synthetase/AMP-(fatty) acid ligase
MSILAPIFDRDPDRIAVRAGDASISYGRFCQDIDTMAHWLNRHGVEPGSRMGIRFGNDLSYWTWVIHLAAIRLGTVHVTIGNIGRFRMARRLASGGITSHVIDARAPPGAASDLNVIRFGPDGMKPLAEQLGVDPIAWPDPETENQAGRVVFTSGTTGKPLPVLWRPAVLADRIEQVERALDISERTVLYSAVGLLAGFGFRFQIPVWRAGGTVLIGGAEEEGVEQRPTIFQESNLLAASPIALRNLLALLPESWPGKDDRTIIAGGGRLSTVLRDEALARACARLEIQYGATETGWMARGDAAMLDRDPGAVGFATDGATIEVVDTNGRPLPSGQLGTIRARTNALADGYEAVGPAGGEGLAADAEAGRGGAFRDGWFYPGDVGRIEADGLLVIAGRTADVVNIGGKKLSIAVIENALTANPALPELCVVPLSFRSGDVLAVVAVASKEHDSSVLREAVTKAMPKGVPIRLLRVPSIPRNETGKVLRQALAQRLVQKLEQE